MSSMDAEEAVANYGEEPPARVCGCGQAWHWLWYAPHNGAHRPRWCAPPVNPCERCTTVTDNADEGEVRDRLRDAGVPAPLWWVDLGNLCVQGDAEEPEAHQQRARRERRLGIPTASREALRVAYGWRPPRWLLLTGPPGVGKTTWLAGLARRLLTRGPDRWETADLPLPGQRTLRRRALQRVEYHRVDELVERERAKMRGLDPHPLVDVARIDILLLDELGLTQRPSEGEARLVERVLCYRHDRGLPTVIATNRTQQELVKGRGLYGARVADRLRGALHAALGGQSWREAA